MSDDNGDVVDSFMPFNTMKEDTAEENTSIINADDGNGTAHRIGENLKIEEVTADVSGETTETEVESDENSSNGLIYGIGGIVLAGIALDTDRMMITQCGNDYHDYSDNKLACIYVKWAEKHCSECLQAETDKGKIYVHIDERITECEREKWKIWKKMRDIGLEYALAMKNADTAKVWQLENLFELQAEEIAVRTCLVV